MIASSYRSSPRGLDPARGWTSIAPPSAKAFSVPAQPYGASRKLRLGHLLFSGKFPLCFGFDRQIELPGGRATIHQAQIFRSHGRQTSFAPSMQLVTDLATDQVHTTLPGGVSDRPFSRLYANRLADWLQHRYAVLTPETPSPFTYNPIRFTDQSPKNKI